MRPSRRRHLHRLLLLLKVQLRRASTERRPSLWIKKQAKRLCQRLPPTSHRSNLRRRRRRLLLRHQCLRRQSSKCHHGRNKRAPRPSPRSKRAEQHQPLACRVQASCRAATPLPWRAACSPSGHLSQARQVPARLALCPARTHSATEPRSAAPLCTGAPAGLGSTAAGVGSRRAMRPRVSPASSSMVMVITPVYCACIRVTQSVQAPKLQTAKPAFR